MSMTISIDNLRTALRDTNAKAAVAFADAEKLKDGMIAAGVDPTEGEHFETVDTAYKGYSVLADNEQALIANLYEKGVICRFSQAFADGGGRFRQGGNRAQHDLPRCG